MTLDTNTAVVLVALIGIVVPIFTTLIKFLQDSRIAAAASRIAADAALEVRKVAFKVEEAGSVLKESKVETDQKLDVIHSLVNDQLTKAVDRFTESLKEIDELKIILRRLAPNDPALRSFNERHE